MTRPRPRAGLLRAALLFNATFSFACAVGALWIADVPGLPLGDDTPLALRGLAAGLLGFVLFLGWQVSRLGRPNPPLFFVGLTILMDEGWVIGSGILLLFVHDDWQSLHLWVVGGVAAVVALAATAQWVGLARFIREPEASLGTRHHYELEVIVDADVADYWAVLSDLGAIADHAADLRSSEVEGHGVGAVRSCANAAGQHWSEEVTRWDPAAHTIDLRFRSELPDFPMPMDPMVGGWRLEPVGSYRTRVTLWWSFTTKPAWAAPMIVALMDRGLRGGMVASIHSMAAEARRGRPALAAA